MCYFHEMLDKKNVLSLDDYKSIIDQTANSRPCVMLSGGEPLVHPDLFEMVEYAKRKNLPVQIFTNGTLAKPQVADRLVELGLDYMNFTLLGDEVSHPLVARAPKSYEMFVKNLEYFANNRGDTELILNYTISPRSIDDIGHAVELVKRYKLDGLRIQHYNYLLPEEFIAQDKVMGELFGSAESNEIEETGDLDGAAEKIIEFMERLSEDDPDIRVQWAPTLSPEEVKDWYSTRGFHTLRKCLYPWRGVTVDATGKVYPCYKIYLELGDLADNTVFDVWNGDKMHKFRENLKNGLYPACARCCKL